MSFGLAHFGVGALFFGLFGGDRFTHKDCHAHVQQLILRQFLLGLQNWGRVHYMAAVSAGSTSRGQKYKGQQGDPKDQPPIHCFSALQRGGVTADFSCSLHTLARAFP